MFNLHRIVLSVAAILVLSLPTNAGPLNASRPPAALDPNQTSNLYLIGKVWGYLKYHHPTITQGCLDWDEQLLRKIPAMLHSTDRKQIVDELESWIDELERPDACAAESLNQQHFGPRIDWRYRLLALYRFWNIVEYWFPYRDVIDEEWDEVLVDSIPRFYSAETQKDYLLELARP